jgi:hypothetical protein
MFWMGDIQRRAIMKIRAIVPVLLAIPLLIFIDRAEARSDTNADSNRQVMLERQSTYGVPFMQLCTHNYNKIGFGISNWGIFGSEGGMRDCETNLPAPSAEFPIGSQLEYLFAGAIWVGAVVGNDTLVSTALDGWQFAGEMYPCSDPGICGLQRRSNRPNDLYYSPDAKSDLEYTAVYTDTLNSPQYTPDDWSGRPYMPLNIEITQTSYSWSALHAEDFIIIDYGIRNIGDDPIYDAYVGLWVDADIGSRLIYNRQQGDLCGYKKTVPSTAGSGLMDTIDLAYAFDNDGDPSGGVYDYRSATSTIGLRFLRLPEGAERTSFNWWSANGNALFDWGPMQDALRRIYGTGGMGVPEGDCNKYYILSNRSIDYDQIYSCEDYTNIGWTPPPSTCDYIMKGEDIMFCISTGPFDLLPNETKYVTTAFVAGEHFHQDPTSFERFMSDSIATEPDSFYKHLSFDDIGRNAVMAARVFDNPGVDTDGDANAGSYWVLVDTVGGEEVIDTFYYAGDGVPDFRAVSPPLSPRIRFELGYGSVRLKWNGLECETSRDPITRSRDFEGYRVYMGNSQTAEALALLCMYDKMDFSIKYKRQDDEFSQLLNQPKTLSELKALFGDDFNPGDYACNDGDLPFEQDGIDYCFSPVGWNQSIRGWLDGATDFDNSGIKKTYADEIELGIVTPEIDSLDPDLWVTEIDQVTGEEVRYHKFYEYEYSINDLFPGEPWYFSVTAIDYGDFAAGTSAAESNPFDNMVQVDPLEYPSMDSERGPQVTVFPNPYYGGDRYARAGYEDPKHTGLYDEERRIHFIDLPAYCNIKIYTMDGDLVRELSHPGESTTSETELEWNLKSKEGQVVTSGIYLFVIESYWGNQVGKIVIIL